MKSWKTTAAGILGALSVIAGQVATLFDTDPGTNPEWNIIVATVMTAVGLFAARDNDVSSESAGAN